MAPQTEEDISRQMQESVEMQVEEFKDVESPLGFKIPKMPGSTDDLSALIGLGDSGEAAASGEKIEDLPSLDELGSKPGQQQQQAGGAPPPPPPPAGGGGMFGGGLFGARRQQ
jgi:hypothetical protein